MNIHGGFSSQIKKKNSQYQNKQEQEQKQEQESYYRKHVVTLDVLNITQITRFTHISICTTSYLQADTKVKYIRMSNHASMKLGNSPKSW